MKRRLLFASVLLTFSCLCASGQTSASLEAKYGPPIKAYEIRPGVLMTVDYADDGRACQMVIERRHTTKEGVNLDSTLSVRLVKELIDELVPVAERGDESKFYGLTIYPTEVTNYSYENASIHLYGNKALIIEWENRGCKRN
jgi:hypothetical protein